MFSKFKLNDFYEEQFNSFYDSGLHLYEQTQQETQNQLLSFIRTDGIIDGSALQQNWFNSKKKYDIFLSHSHQDKKLAISLAGFLKEKLDLSTFIDSCLWGYSNDLLREIDNIYCQHSNRTSYDYDKRNYSTSHVHMMLAIALGTMIDNCESVFFLNTPNSISLSEGIGNGQTMSPWIYHELASANIIRQKSLERYRNFKLLRHSAENRYLFENANQLQITYDVEKLLNQFLPLSSKELTDTVNWHLTNNEFDSALDCIYKIKGVIA